MQFRQLSLILLTMIFCAGMTIAQEQKKITVPTIDIFAGQLLKGWHVGGWGGVDFKLQPLKDRDAKVLHLQLNAAPQNWAGVFLSTTQPTGKTQAEIAMSQSLKKTGTLVLSINGSNDEWGNPVGQQKLQIAIAQRTEKSKWLHGSKFLPLKSFVTGNMIDDNPETWQQVRIPLAKLLTKEDLPALGAVFLQYIAQPTGSVMVRSICIEP